MNEGIITSIVKNILIPEILGIIKRLRDRKNGVEPTEAEVFAELEANVDRGVAIGQAYLARTDGPQS